MLQLWIVIVLILVPSNPRVRLQLLFNPPIYIGPIELRPVLLRPSPDMRFCEALYGAEISALFVRRGVVEDDIVICAM